MGPPESGTGTEAGGAVDAPVGTDAEGDAGPPRSLHAVMGKSFGGRDPSADAGAAMEVGAIAVAAGGGATLIGNFQYASVNLGGNTLQKDGSSRDVFVLAVDAAGTHVTPERFGDALAQTGSGIVTIGTTTFAAINHAGKVMFNGGAEADSVGVSNAVVGKLTTPALISRATGAGVITLRSIAAADVSGGVVAISEARS